MSKYSIEVFAAGTWTDANGITRTFTVDDLLNIARTYNEQDEHDAPVVIGHPIDNTPAQGWTERLFVKNDRLWATVRDLSPEFTEAVRQGKYRKKSIALYEGGLLRHIGFVAIPAVKGLRDDFEPAIFNDNGRAFAEFAAPNNKSTSGVSAMDEQQFNELKNLLTQILNLVGNKAPAPGMPPAAGAPPMQAGAPAYAAPMFNDPNFMNAFSQFMVSNGYAPNMNVGAHNANGSNMNGNAEVERLRKELAESKRNATRSEFAEFVNSSDIAQRVPTYMRDSYINWLIDAREKDEKAQSNGAQFGEANPTEVDKIKKQLAQLPKLVDLNAGEFAESGDSQGGIQGREKQISTVAKSIAQRTKR
jgi:hypothetical protein